MPRTQRRLAFLSIYLVGAVCVTLAALHANENRPPATAATHVTGMHPAIAEMTAAATAWWNSLTREEQAKGHFEFNDANRFDWHFIPRERKGLPYREMTSSQRALATAFLASGLSSRAFMQAETIMSLDQILKEIEPGPPKTPYRDPENYSFTVFGTPSESATWGWRVEGHHLSLNFTIVDGRTVVGGPVFFGSNPAEVRTGPRTGLRVLGHEDDAGFAIMKTLTEQQKKTAIIETKAPNEVITNHDRKANPGEPVGLAFAAMTPDQKKEITDLVEFYAHRLRPEMAADDLAKIDAAGWDKVHFAWAGGAEPGTGHYYRLHGPTFIVEMDNTQNNANHVHTVWRDSANDFGEDLLKEHYDAHASDPAHGHVAPAPGK